MISRRVIFVLALGAGLAALGPQVACAQQQQYLEEAIAETKEAIAAGKQSLSSSFVEHVDVAYDRARSAVWQNPVESIRKGIKALRKATKLAKGTNSEKRMAKATEQAEFALQQFESAR
ncbi:MAG: hypothetical protein CTY15_06025 [Methylocystis sp.]|nr:MAG: hypothetical protein CTY15_06025 [Methylocystis sp.]